MQYLFYTYLFIFWTLFWSFASVLIYRLKKREKWIIWWRSHCPKCNTVLKFADLIPIFSWLKNRWKCMYCKEKVSSIYILLELSAWLLFALIWYFLLDYNLIFSWNITEITKMFFWLSIWFITILYTFYDILFLEVHDWILFVWISIVILWLILQTIWLVNIFDTISLVENSFGNLVIYSSIFLSITIIWLLYLIMLKWLKEWLDVIIILSIIWALFAYKNFFWINLWEISILNWVISALAIFIFFFIQILISKWAWLWWWDLRIAIMLWLIVWISYSISSMMITYFAWSIIWIAIIIISKLKNKKNTIDTQIPFWPFLAIWLFITVFYTELINEILNNYF